MIGKTKIWRESKIMLHGYKLDLDSLRENHTEFIKMNRLMLKSRDLDEKSIM